MDENKWVTRITPRKINMEPENTSLEKENHLPNHHFSGFKLIFGGVTRIITPISGVTILFLLIIGAHLVTLFLVRRAQTEITQSDRNHPN